MGSQAGHEPSRESREEDLVKATTIGVLRACDIVFSTIVTSLGIVGIWLAMAGEAHISTIVAVWAMPAMNLVWSAATRHSDRIFTDAIRGVLCLPVESTLTMARHEYYSVADVETELGDLPLVRCFIGELNQVVLNIVVNAAHAIGDVVKGTARKGRIRVRSYREGSEVVITISDTGSGIPEHVRAKIFDPFFTTKEVGRGTGQGLAIARSVIVEKHRGQLDFETELGNGTTFLIRLPIDGAQATRADAA